ncbi:hypothetical protein [Trichlorobacter ammonificans]|nr:hypothetical protein [Trichlorobacter ammonificans]
MDTEKNNHLVFGRECGGCFACCVTLRIDTPELQKYADISCHKIAPGGGCAIYPNRPGVCRSWFCVWRYMPQLDDDWRPDKSKIIIRCHPEIIPGLILQPLERSIEVLTSHQTLQLIGGCVEQSVPVFISVPTREGFCHALLSLNQAFAKPVASHIFEEVKAAMMEALNHAKQIQTDPIQALKGERQG